MSPTVIFYHAPCTDGAFAAFAAARRFKRTESVLVPLRNELTEDQRIKLIEEHVIKGADVFLLDIVGSKPFLLALCDKALTVVLIDHHKTTEEILTDMPEKPINLQVVFDAKKSGAVLAYEYFGLEATVYNSLWPVFELVQDNDLWLHQLPNTKAFTAGFMARRYDYNDGEALVKAILLIDEDEVIAEGRALLEKRASLIKEIGAKASGCCFNGIGGNYVDLDANDAEQMHIISELGQALAQASGMGAMLIRPVQGQPGCVKVSMRSIGDVDVSAIAKKNGGGGHKNAASFVIAEEKLVVGGDFGVTTVTIE